MAWGIFGGSLASNTVRDLGHVNDGRQFENNKCHCLVIETRKFNIVSVPVHRFRRPGNSLDTNK